MALGFSYIESDTPVHRCDGRVKIALLFVYSIVLLALPSWWLTLGFCVVPWVVALVARIPPRTMAAPLIPVAVLAVFAGLFSYVADPGWGGALKGAMIALRMICLVAASFVVCFTTRIEEMLRAFAFFLEPLRRLSVPVDDIAFTLSLALRFIPQIAGDYIQVRQAQRARGAGRPGLGFFRRLQIEGCAFTAVFIGLFRQASATATAMDARCYGAAKKRGTLPK